MNRYFMGKVLQFPGTEKPVVLEAHEPNNELNSLIAEVIEYEKEKDLELLEELKKVRLELKSRVEQNNNTRQDWAALGKFDQITRSFIKG